MKHKKHKHTKTTSHKIQKSSKFIFRKFLLTRPGLLVVGLLVLGAVVTPFVASYALQNCSGLTCSAVVDSKSGASAGGGTVRCSGSGQQCAAAVAAAKKAAAAKSTAKQDAKASKTADAAKQTADAAAKTAAGTAASPPPAPPAAPAPPPVSSHTSAKYGIAAGSSLTHLSGGELSKQLDDMRSMGVGWVRFDLEWSNIEPSQGSYNWGAYDAVVNGVRARGMRVIAVIDYTPAWARPGGCGSDKCAPADPANYGNFAGVVAAHYSGQGIAAYEIWNEPNSTDFYKPVASTAQYTQLLSAAYPKIKAASPSSQVITGGTSPRSTGNGNLSPIDFVQGLYDSGAKNYFDAVAAHPYTFPVTAAYPSSGNAWGQLDTFRNIMVQNGDAGKQLWSTEYGAPTGGPGPTATAGNLQIGSAWHVDEALQAQAVTDAIRLNSAVSWKGPLLWYAYKDAGTTQDTNENFFGLVRADGSHKPAYDSFIQALNTYN